MKDASSKPTILAIAIAAGLFIPLGTEAASTVAFDNKSGRPALVKLVGPTATSVSVGNNQKESVTVLPGHYFIKTRYGTLGNYSYSKGDEFDVTETPATASAITITLHKLVAGNYGSKSISETEFGGDQLTNTQPLTTVSETLTPELGFQLDKPIRLTNNLTVTVTLKKGPMISGWSPLLPTSEGHPDIEAGYDLELWFQNDSDTPVSHMVFVGASPDAVRSVNNEKNAPLKYAVETGAKASNIFIVEDGGGRRFPIALGGKGFDGKDSSPRVWRHVLFTGGTALCGSDSDDGLPIGVEMKAGSISYEPKGWLGEKSLLEGTRRMLFQMGGPIMGGTYGSATTARTEIEGGHIGVAIVLCTAKGESDLAIARFPSSLKKEGAALHLRLLGGPHREIVVNLPND